MVPVVQSHSAQQLKNQLFANLPVAPVLVEFETVNESNLLIYDAETIGRKVDKPVYISPWFIRDKKNPSTLFAAHGIQLPSIGKHKLLYLSETQPTIHFDELVHSVTSFSLCDTVHVFETDESYIVGLNTLLIHALAIPAEPGDRFHIYNKSDEHYLGIGQYIGDRGRRLQRDAGDIVNGKIMTVSGIPFGSVFVRGQTDLAQFIMKNGVIRCGDKVRWTNIKGDKDEK